MGVPSHLRCDRVVELVSDYLDRNLRSADAERLEQHLIICDACGDYVEQMRCVLEGTKQLKAVERDPTEPQVAPQLLDAFRRWKGK